MVYMILVFPFLRGQYFTAYALGAIFNSILPRQTMDVMCTVSVLGRDEGYTVKYTPERVPKGKARENSCRQRGIFDRISLVSS